ncbi:MAG TPA: ribulose-phosphate 3-epimerase, partial [Limnochordales bacterium]
MNPSPPSAPNPRHRPRPVLVAPSLLSADFARLADEVARVPNADWLHVDVMDGHFVPNLTLGPPVVAALRRVTSLPLDVHLMVERPEHLVEAFAAAGADHLTVHVEAAVHLDRLLRQIRSLGLRSGVALNPATPPQALEYALEAADQVVVMTVNPGFGGQEFLAGMLRKVAQVRAMVDRQGLAVEVVVDGGVDARWAGQLVEAGATVLV